MAKDAESHWWDRLPFGPPYPRPGDPVHPVYASQKTLRDWFAGQALPMISYLHNVDLGDDRIELAAQTAYRLADAMLKERSK